MILVISKQQLLSDAAPIIGAFELLIIVFIHWAIKKMDLIEAIQRHTWLIAAWFRRYCP